MIGQTNLYSNSIKRFCGHLGYFIDESLICDIKHGTFILPIEKTKIPENEPQLPGSIHLIKNGINLWLIHEGMDLYGKKDTKIMAVSDGVVYIVENSPEGMYGKCIYINHKDGITCSVYSHIEPLVKEEEQVLAGKTIGLCGSTYFGKEHSGLEHLHFEIRTGIFSNHDCPKDGTMPWGKNPVKLMENLSKDKIKLINYIKNIFEKGVKNGNIKKN